MPAATNAFSTSNAVNAADLRSTVAEKIPAMQEEVKAFRKSHGSAKIGEITVDSLYGGMRMKGLVTETSVLDTEEGIRSTVSSLFHMILTFINQVPWLHNPRVPGAVTKGTRRRGASSRGSLLASAHWRGPHRGAGARALRGVGQQGRAAQPRGHPAEQPPLQRPPHDPVCLRHCCPQL